MPAPAKTLGEKIRIGRQARDLSQEELAKKTSLHQESISRYEAGTSAPNTDTLKKIADALEVTTDYLLSENADENMIMDKALIDRLREIEKMDDKRKGLVMDLLDITIRDYKTQKAYS